jgi:hypothetical protein
VRNICDAILVLLPFNPFDAYDRNARPLAAPGLGDQRGRAVVHRPGGILSQEPLDVTMIRLTDVSKTFDEGHSYAVRNLSLEVREGETLVLLGSAGCGRHSPDWAKRLVRTALQAVTTRNMDPEHSKDVPETIADTTAPLPEPKVGRNIVPEGVEPGSFEASIIAGEPNAMPILRRIATAPDGHRDSFASCVTPELTYHGGAGGDTREHPDT